MADFRLVSCNNNLIKIFDMNKKIFNNKKVQIALRKLKWPSELSKAEIIKAINTIAQHMNITKADKKNILDKMLSQIKE